MTTAILLVIFVLVVAMVLFSIDIFPTEVVALGILLVLVVGGVLTPQQAFDGFSSETSITILGLLLLSTALVRTGVVHLITRQILGQAKGKPSRVWWIVTALTGLLSSFMSNTAVAAFFTPVTLNISRRTKINPSKLLMPMAFASILASSVTLIATSTNLVVSGLLRDSGLKPLGIFELTPVGLIILAVGLVYMYFIGSKLIPIRNSSDDQDEYKQLYFGEARLPESSNWAGKTLRDLRLGEKFEVTVLRIRRADGQRVVARADTPLEACDRLSLQGSRESMLGIKQLPELEFVASLEQVEDNTGKSTQIAEVLVMPNSDLIDRTLKRLAFRERYGLQVLAIHRRDQMLTRQIGTIKLQAGDQLLLQGNSETIDSLSQSGSFRVLDKEIDTPVDLPRARLVVCIFASVMALVALNLLPLQVAVMFGVFGVFVTGALKPAQAYRSVAWGAWILVCCMLALGKAIEVSGFADLVTNGVIQTLKLTNPYVLLAIFFGLAMLLTQPMSNQAAAVIIIPIAIQTAQRLGFDPRTFAIMIAVGASCSFITPLEPACLMVYNPGNYRFFDFTRVGAFLTLIIFGIAILLVPMLWPL